MCDLYVVTVDTRGKSSSDITGYHEHTCSQTYFNKMIAGHPDAICFKSKVAELCGVDLNVYFHKEDSTHIPAEGGAAARTELNRAATLLTLDPATGFARYHVRGVAYVVMSNGLAPLSFRQVWGIQELANYATDVYKSDPDHQKRGKENLLRSCKQYRQRTWGPLSIYKPRPEVPAGGSVAPPSVIQVKPNSRRAIRSSE
jgi:uncharacterized short protein YbdD (DUF466 family)